MARTCPKCGAKLGANRRDAGSIAVCPECSKSVKVPNQSSTSISPKLVFGRPPGTGSNLPSLHLGTKTRSSRSRVSGKVTNQTTESQHSSNSGAGEHRSESVQRPDEPKHQSWFRSFFVEILFIGNFKTAVAISKDYKKFFDEVFVSDYTNKMKPVPFYVLCLAINLVVTSVFGSPFADVNWDSTLDYLTEHEIVEFVEAFDLRETVESGAFDRSLVMESVKPGTSRVSLRIIEKAGSAKAIKVSEYLKSTGHDDLAFSIMKGIQKVAGENDIWGLIDHLMIPIYFLGLAWLSHIMLNCKRRTRKETVIVMSYVGGLALISGSVVEPLTEWTTQSLYEKIPQLSQHQLSQSSDFSSLFLPLILGLTLGIIALFGVIFFTTRLVYRILRYTHDASFLRLFFMWFVTVTLIRLMIVVPQILYGESKAVWSLKGYNSTIQDVAHDRIIVSSDSLCQITIPAHWKKLEALHEDATIQVGNSFKGEYIIVLTDRKEEFSGTLEEHAAITSAGIMNSISEGSKTELEQLKINGYRALRYRIDGLVDRTRITYLQTTFEGKKGYYQVLAWCTAAHAPEALDTFVGVAKTFKELQLHLSIY
jgi:hypothetical protein